jgi:hypothetical protein
MSRKSRDVSEQKQLLASLQALVESRDRPDGESRAGDVGDAQRQRLYAREQHELLACRLGDAVTGERRRRVRWQVSATVCGRP